MKQHRETETPTLPEKQASQAANGAVDTATLDLLATWQREDATSNPDELRAAEQELAEFKKAMNENRSLSGEPLLYP